MLSIKYVPIPNIYHIWEDVKKFIESALEYSDGDYTLDHVKVFLTNGSWLLLIAVEDEQIKGAAAINFINMPNDRIGFIVAMGGRLISNEDTYEQLVSIMKAHGATKMQCTARESTARLWSRYGFKEKYAIVEAKI